MPTGAAEPVRPDFDGAIAAIDAANAEDPTSLAVRGSPPRPKELVHAELVTDWVRRLDPTASEEQLLAARAHHFRRWTLPRSGYPEGRTGYLQWRRDAARKQAAEVGELLRAHGYRDDAVVDRVGRIIRKESRATDAAVQTHEDALCLVFIETQLEDVAGRLGDDAALGVLSRTLAKMSPAGRRAARELELAEPAARLLESAGAGGAIPPGPA